MDGGGGLTQENVVLVKENLKNESLFSNWVLFFQLLFEGFCETIIGLFHRPDTSICRQNN